MKRGLKIAAWAGAFLGGFAIVQAATGWKALTYLDDTLRTQFKGVTVGFDDESGAAVPVSATDPLPVSGTVSMGGTVTVTDGSGALNVIVDSSALPSGAATSALQANGPNASCASYKSTTTTVSKTGASVDLSATGNTKWSAWRNNSRTYRITITDPASTTITLWPNDSVQFSVDAAATPDNTTATCPDCGSATTYFTGVGCDD